MSAPGNDRAPRRDNRRATSGQAGSGTTTSVRRPSGSSAPDTQPSGDLADVVPLCLTCAGTGEAPAKPLRAGVVAALCLGAACAAPLVPVGWWAP